ncbi:succinate dehydrogenase assembly factor 2 [Hoeflea prorocentri]|uniref:FAD assembly factor SdhE n=1 Tax=Hoeflea prorocentri TaxID=1922333 RepID=A0A9X3UHM1_9HYPH|nr:succinate dehydrogenase assembly factor 2 [Hoeflea prorocentri]MCY6380786.1 succinate dehydrogenase assembly factor 2 [Hoeflea prorocentri]MDA5398586.1 succinate dehydrogenase assembly factor 2 [Hoeflea prorocentri]
MTGTTRTSAELDPRRRRILFRSWHRGIREMDLILGQFADSNVDTMTTDELDFYETLLEIDDRNLLQWVTGEVPTPAQYDTDLFRRIRDYKQDDPTC